MQRDTPELSLVVATVGRTDTLVRLLDSLRAQTSRCFEVIVVDQNPGDELVPVLQAFAGTLALVHARSPKGLSKARNAGLRLARGHVVAFPDDDCWYDREVVEQCLARFGTPSEVAGFTGMTVDEADQPSVGRFDGAPGRIDKFNVWRRANSTTMFVRTEVARTVDGFDELLGLGAGTRWGSGEETDFLLRALLQGYVFLYDPALRIRHPQADLRSAAMARRRALPYARGFQRVLAKHRYPLSFQLISALRPFGGALFHALRGRPPEAALSFWSGVGRLQELIAHPWRNEA